MRLRRYNPDRDDPVAVYKAFVDRLIPMVYLGMWADETAARAVLEYLWEQDGITADEVPRVCRMPWFQEHRLTGLLHRYRNSPYLLLTMLYPGRWEPMVFAEVPFAPDLRAEVLTAEGISPEEPPIRRRHLVQVARARRLGLCQLCSRPLPHGSRSPTCPECRKRAAAEHRAERQQRRANGMCTIIGCPRPAAPGRVRCEVHTSMETRRRGRSRQELGRVDDQPKK